MMRKLVFAQVLLHSLVVSAQTITAPAEVTTPDPVETATPAPAPQQAPNNKSGQVERVEVTGSHIKRIDVEGTSPVTTIKRAELEKSGYNSVSDVLRDTTANTFGSVREDSGSNAAGVATVNLRGLGSTNTLVLLNGQRLPSDAVTGAVDLNLIPMAAVERIEILKDGASAIYGSDALGGVVNIITRRDFSGNEVSLSQTLPEKKGGARSEVSLVNGINRERWNMVNVVQYRDNKSVYSRDRDWSNDGVSNIGSPGSYRNAGGTWNADPNCPSDRLVTTPAGTFCSFRYSDYATELPALQQLSVLSETNYELNSDVRLTGRLSGTQKRVQWSYAPAPGTFTIPGAVADTLGSGGNPLPGVTPGQNLQVQYRLLELGTRDARVVTNAYNALLGANIQVPYDWQVDVTGSYNEVRTKDEGVSGYALTQELTDAISSGQFNPFAPEGQRGSIESARYTPVEKMKSQLTSAEAKASGAVGELPAGPVGLAVGTTFTHQKFEDVFDERSVNNEVFGNAGSSGGGKRDTRSVFSEVSVPVTQKLELQVAGRYDHYSDFGDTANPKGAFLYKPTNEWLVRGSVGTGFKAPLMQDLYASSSIGYPTFIDYVSCERERQAGGATPSCTPQQYQVTSGGNTGLKEEKSISYNLGTVFEPNRNFSVGTDVFLTKVKNVVGIDYSDAMLAESQGINLANYGVVVTRDANGYIESVEAPLQNLSSQEVSGLDLSSAYRFRQVRLSTEHSHMFYFKEEGFPGTGLKDKLGEYGRPRWRNATAVTYMPGERHDLTVIGITTAGQKKSVEEAGRLRDYTTYDFHYSYKSPNWGTFTAGVKNLLGTTPPLDDSNPNGQLNTSLYDQIGRQYFAGYKKTF